MTPTENAIVKLGRNPLQAHRILFPHRHTNLTPAFHLDLLRSLYSTEQFQLFKAFRGAGKSTLSEEKLIIDALLTRKKFSVVVGNSYNTACDRMTAIKYELETNEAILTLFGEQKGSTWTENEIVLANGSKIKAYGTGQSLRGAKHRADRPDQVFVDDLEDEQMVATEEARHKTLRWISGALEPALTPEGNIIFLGTPLHPDAALEVLAREGKYVTRTFPIVYLDEHGEERAMWEDRFSLEWCDAKKEEYAKRGSLIEWEQEYMCRAENVALKPFQAAMFQTRNETPMWTAKYVMVDPARTVNEKKSARTGYAVWSWVGNKLIVHDAYGAFHRPDEIIAEIFKLDEEYSPVVVGVEAVGLEEFIMQPLRAEMRKRGHSIPLIDIRAPKDKDRFIAGLQPFFQAREVVFAKAVPDLVAELVQFPTGRKDVPNALAYALKLRSGALIYGDFNLQNIETDVAPLKSHPLYLAMSARAAMTTAVLVQLVDGAIRIIADWVVDAPPLDAFTGIFDEALMMAGRAVKLVAPQQQFEVYNNHGLIAAARRKNLEIQRGGQVEASRGCLKPYFQKMTRGLPAVMVSTSARWSLNAFGGGYARSATNSGALSDQPDDNQYRTLMEGLESFVGWFTVLSSSSEEEVRYAYANDGRRFMSSIPQRA